MNTNYLSCRLLVLISLPVSTAYSEIVVGTEFTNRTFADNVVTVGDYVLSGVASPGNLTFNGPNAFMTSDGAIDRAIPIRNAPNWDTLIPINVAGTNIALTDISITFEAFGNSQISKTTISNGFSPNYQPTVRLLDSSQQEIDSQTLDAWMDNGNNLAAGWTGVFNFVSDDILLSNTNYFIQIDMTGSNGNNVGIDSLSINGIVGGGNSLTSWLANFPGVGQENGFDDDPDGDGIGNALENFFGTEPDKFSAGLTLNAVNTGSGTFTITHPQNDGPADDVSGVSYQWSKDLATFTDDGQALEGTTVTFGVPENDPVTDLTTVTATVTGTSINKLFVQVGVTKISPE